jgi:hypothetical protein
MAEVIMNGTFQQSSLPFESSFLAGNYTIAAGQTYLIPIGQSGVANNLTVNGSIYIIGYQYVAATLTVGNGAYIYLDGGGTATLIIS